MRRLGMLAIVGMLLAALPVVVAAGPAQAGPHTVFIKVSDRSVTKGATVRVFGSVLPARARPLKLLVSDDGAWKTIKRTATSAGGSYSFSDRVRNTKTRLYRVCKIGGSAKCSKVVRVKVRTAGGGTSAPTQPSLTVTEGATHELTTDDSYDISGTASSDLIGKPVYLQLYSSDDTSWASISSPVYVANDGSWQITAAARQAGRTLKLRVFAPETKSTRTAHVEVGTFTVYGWYYLDTFNEVAGGWNEGTRAINGVTYPRSIYDYGAYVEYNLSRSCRSLSATVGLHDTSSSSVRVTTWVAGDSTELRRLSDIGLGRAIPLTLDVTGILRLRLEVARTTGSGSWDLVYGDARVLCAY